MKIAWLHIPKTGSNFGTALMHLANHSLPKNAMIKQDSWGDHFYRWPPEIWFNDDIFWTPVYGKKHGFGWHSSLDEDIMQRYQIFTMMRRPNHLGWSAYNYFLGPEHRRLISPISYAYVMQGVMTNMISGTLGKDGLKCLVASAPRFANWSLRPSSQHTNFFPKRCPVKGDIQKSIARLHNFAFVGLVEKWDLSICLFSIMFNAPCRNVMFHKTHVTNMKKSNRTIGREHLFSHRDDDHIYNISQRIFARNLLIYNVSENKCIARCGMRRYHKTKMLQ